MHPATRITRHRTPRRLGLALLALVFAVGLTGCELVTVVQHQGSATVTGLPASGKVKPGERLAPEVAVSLANPVEPAEFGRVNYYDITLVYTRANGSAAKAGPFLTGKNTRVPADAKVGTTVDMIVTVKSLTVPGPLPIGVSQAQYSEKAATLEVTGDGGDCPAPQSAQPVPEARLFATATPMSKSVAVSVDARGSTDPRNQPLRYLWDLKGDCVFTEAGTSGLVQIEPNSTSVVRVRVIDGDRTGQAEIPITWADLSTNATITAPASVESGGRNIVVTVSRGDSSIGLACLDDDRDGVHDVVLNFAAAGTVNENHQAVTASNVGYYRLSATMWRAGANDDCANKGTSGEGLVQVVQTGYRVFDRYSRTVPFGSARYAIPTSATARQGSAKQYVATSSLRLNPTGNPVRGKVDKNGVVRGMVTRGTFTFKTPAKAGKAKRPAGLADLAKGTYVARAKTSTISGTGAPGKGVYTGVSTVLLRGTNGTLACITADASIASSVLTMRGGTKNASRLVFTATQTQAPFSLPTVAEFNKLQKAKKSPKTKPVNGKGPITASTGKKARGLNGTCKSLQKYLR